MPASQWWKQILITRHLCQLSGYVGRYQKIKECLYETSPWMIFLDVIFLFLRQDDICKFETTHELQVDKRCQDITYRIHTYRISHTGYIHRIHTYRISHTGYIHTGYHIQDTYIGYIHTGYHIQDTYIGYIHTGYLIQDTYIGYIHTGYHIQDTYIGYIHRGYHIVASNIWYKPLFSAFTEH